MSWSGNGRYWGPRPAGPSTAEASGWWDSRSQFGAKRSNVWPLANLRLLSMGFGSGLLDDSSYSRAVGTSGTVTWASGQHATVSADSGFTLGASQSLELAGDFTIEAWFNLPALGTFRIFAAPAAGGQEIFQCAVVAAGTVLFSSTGTGGNRTMTASGYPLVTANAWHHLAFVRSGGEIRAYLNGQWLGVSVTGITGTLLQGQSPAFPRVSVSFGNVAGSLDDVIVSAAALYASNFTPPSRSVNLPPLLSLPVADALVRINPNAPGMVFDADTSGSAVSVGGAVGRVEDFAGNGHHAFNSDSGTRPTLTSPAWINGRLGLDFAGSKRLENWSLPAIGTGEYTVFTVLSANATSVGGTTGAATATQVGRGTSAAANGVNNGAFLINGRSDWRAIAARLGGAVITTTSPTLAANTPYLVVGRRNANTLSLWINGSATVPASAAVSQNIIGGYALGSLRSTVWDQPWPGHVFEHIVYARALTDQERQDVENQLMAYWGMA